MRKSVFAGLAVAALAVYGSVSAHSIVSDRMVVTDASGKVLPVIDGNGNVLPNGLLPEQVEPTNIGASNLIVFGPVSVPTDPRLDASTNLQVGLNDPTGTLSDALFVIITAPPGGPTELVQINFASDPESQLGGVAAAITETGQLQDVTRLLFPGFTGSAAPPFKVSVQSDVEAAVPEPSTLPLLAFALGLLPLIRGRTTRGC